MTITYKMLAIVSMLALTYVIRGLEMTITYKTLAIVSTLTLTYVIRGLLNDHDELRNYTVKKINKLEQQVNELKDQKGD